MRSKTVAVMLSCALALVGLTPAAGAAEEPWECTPWETNPTAQRCVIHSQATGFDIPVVVRPGSDPASGKVATFLDGMYIYGDSGWLPANQGQALERLANFPEVTLVFPAGPSGSLYTDFGGGPQFVDFYHRELPELLEREFGVAAGGYGHTFIGGISAGAFGALSLASQDPGRYASVMGLSGFYNPDTPFQYAVTDVRPLIDPNTDLALRRAPWSDRRARAQANPSVNLGQLTMPVFISAASGLIVHPDLFFSGSDPQAVAATVIQGGPMESMSWLFSEEFIWQARLAGKTNFRFNFDALGTHSWDTWRRASWDRGLVYEALSYL